MCSPAPIEHCYRDIRVAVLGASGFIGRWVARRLHQAGTRATLVVRNRESVEPLLSGFDLEGDVIAEDLLQPGAIERVVGDLRPAITFNCVGYGVDRAECDPHLASEINTQLVGRLARTLAAQVDGCWKGQTLVHLGSAWEYGVSGKMLTEDVRGEPTSTYGRTKLAGTELLAAICAETGLKALTARLFTVYGPGEHAGRLLPSLIEAHERDEPLELSDGAQQRDFCYVEEVAEGLMRLGAAASQPGEIVNLATGRLTAVRDFALTAARLLGLHEHRLRFGLLARRPDEVVQAAASVERLRARTAWELGVDIEAGIGRTIAFYRQAVERV